MQPFDLPTAILDRTIRDRVVARLREGRVRLPTFQELAAPRAGVRSDADPDAADPANLFRMHWFNAADRHGVGDVPGYLELPSALTGVPARIVVMLGERFPMIGAHKVLPAYACLVVRLVTGLFDPTRQRAVWPSTGNYCRGGVAISRILGCRGIAVLPEGMSRERFDWLSKWVADPADIVKTPGTESNVREIYDACAELARKPENDIINQFVEFANYIVHRLCTGHAISRLFGAIQKQSPTARLAAFVAATGSGGTLAAGDHLKATHGTKIVAVEPIECPTMLYNGYGAHNIQGIGDKHIPLIQNVMNSDVIVGISDQSTDVLNVLFNTDTGRSYLSGRKAIPDATVQAFRSIGISGLCNILAAIKTAKRLDLSENDVIVTVATDNAAMYQSEREKTVAQRFHGRFGELEAAETYGHALSAVVDDYVLELSTPDRRRVFNLGYFTWVEQQGIALDDFNRRLRQEFWNGLSDCVPAWDDLITGANRDAGIN